MSTKLPDIQTNFAEWYQEIVYQAELADQAPVKGCMVIRPYGYAIWENIQKILDKKIKDTGHQNAAFPLLIPQSFLKKEAQHVAGFAPELAVVTHAGGKELEEPLVVRPTSETIIHYMFAQWLRSYRDLPILINQWCSVVRWEMRTRPFLRTTEFWWQEGHTAHETYEEAEAEARLMLAEYVDLIENYLAIPVVPGLKSDSERFAGAEKTFTMEGLMQDGKALQMGTSHMISQSFAEAFDMKFQDRHGKLAYPHLTSWGVTTRLIGGLIMTHGDAKGLIMPPRIAPIQIVIIPILLGDTAPVLAKAEELRKQLLAADIRVIVDADDQNTPGAKFYKWELKGVPLRIEVGPRDLKNNQAMMADRLGLSKQAISFDNLVEACKQQLAVIQAELLKRAVDRRSTMWHKRAKFEEFAEDLEAKGGFYQTGWCRNIECETRIKTAKATIRCVLNEKSFPVCFNCDKASESDILIAKAY
jgi:prolyl-tRNA synthetase